MAIQINTDVKTADGFTVRPFVFLNIQLFESLSRSYLAYYKDKAAFENGESPLMITSLPTSSNGTLTAQEFWGSTLAMDLHLKAVAQIEEVTGPGTCSIVTLEGVNLS